MLSLWGGMTSRHSPPPCRSSRRPRYPARHRGARHRLHA
jgi:hypothetical protein